MSEVLPPSTGTPSRFESLTDRNALLDQQSELISLLYQSTLEPSHLQQFLQRLCQEINSVSAAITVVDVEQMQVNAVWQWGYTQEQLTAFFEADLINQSPLVKTVLSAPTGQFYLSNIDLPELSQQADAPDSYQWTQNFDLTTTAGAALHIDGNHISTIMISRNSAQGGFTEDERTYLNRLIPHVRQSLGIRQHISQLQQSLLDMPAIVESLPLPAMVIDHTFCVIASNQRAAQWMARTGVAKLEESRFTLSNRYRTNLFNNHLIQALQVASGQETAFESVFELSLDSGESVSFVFHPVSRTRGEEQLPAVLCFIHHNRQTVEISTSALEKIFGLSPREAQVCKLLAEGKDIPFIAEELKLSVHTVRDYVKKRLFVKCGCRSQLELVTMVLSSPVLFLS